MAAPPPTFDECCEWITEHCNSLLGALNNGTSLDQIKHDVRIALDSVLILAGALDAPPAVSDKLTERVHQLRRKQTNDPLSNKTMVKDLIKGVHAVCNECKIWSKQCPSFVSISSSKNFRVEVPKIVPDQAAEYACMWPDQMDARSYWFRQYFVGKPYITLIGMSDSSDSNASDQGKCHVIISVVQERIGKDSTSQYRAIVRGKDAQMGRHLIAEEDAIETESRLAAAGLGSCLDCVIPVDKSQQRNRRPLRSISSAIIQSSNSSSSANANRHDTLTNNGTRLLRASVRTAYPDIDLRNYRELSAEATILSGLEKEILRFDEMEIPKLYKFGVLTIRDNQTTEEAWFSNSGLSAPLKRFLDIMGKEVELKGYMGYAAGLDTKSGESGLISFASSWRDYEIMFHVAPLMPLRDNDKQQVSRKRHLGNDIVCVVFMEGDHAKFDPDAIRSQFLHVYVVVHPERINNKEAWRIQVVTKETVSDFGPPTPSPSIIYNENELRGFLMLKLINAENAALKSEKFIKLNTKARASVLKALHETGLAYADTQCNATRCGEDKRSDRPKSAGAQRVSRGSMRSIRTVFTDHPPRSMTPNIPPPPIPASSRSSMLRDWRYLTRRRSSGSGGQSSDTDRGWSPSPATAEIPLPVQDGTNVQARNTVTTQSCSTGLSSTTPAGAHESETNNGYNGNNSNCNSSNNNNNNSGSNNNIGGGIRSKAQHLVTSMIGRRNHTNRQQTSTSSTALRAVAAGGLIRSRTFMIDHAGKLIQGERPEK